MVEAFIEVLGNESQARKQLLLNRQHELQEKIAEIERQILQSQTETKDARSRLENAKKMVHYLSSEEAKRAVEELNKTLDELNIEIVGIQVKLQAIAEEHDKARAVALKSDDARRKVYETIIWPRLEQMRIDEIIAFKVAEAKKATAEGIRRKAEEFYNMSILPIEIEGHLSFLKANLSSSQSSLESIEHELKQTGQLATPPKVFQDRVAIYPVAGIRRR
jgi:hypothetical protein